MSSVTHGCMTHSTTQTVKVRTLCLAWSILLILWINACFIFVMFTYPLPQEEFDHVYSTVNNNTYLEITENKPPKSTVCGISTINNPSMHPQISITHVLKMLRKIIGCTLITSAIYVYIHIRIIIHIHTYVCVRACMCVSVCVEVCAVLCSQILQSAQRLVGGRKGRGKRRKGLVSLARFLLPLPASWQSQSDWSSRHCMWRVAWIADWTRDHVGSI